MKSLTLAAVRCANDARTFELPLGLLFLGIELDLAVARRE